MNISQAVETDVVGLARLVWLMADGDERARGSVADFAKEFSGWWAAHRDSHVPFVARLEDPEIVGMAWVASLPRVPRPGSMERISADIQSVFVMPQYRSTGIGSALVDAAVEHAAQRGCARVTVHSSSRSVPMYERLGFESSRQLLQRPPD